MVFLRQTGMQTAVDAPVSDLLAHWIAEQQQRDDLCLPTIFACASGHALAFLLHVATCEMEGGPPTEVMRPPCKLSWRPEACPASFRHCL